MRKVSIKEIKYWLGDDYHKWIHNVIWVLVNGDKIQNLECLNYEIRKATKDSKEANK